MKTKIREILTKTAKLPVDVGTVELMMALEEAFDLEFPDKMMNRRNFASISGIEQALQSILSEHA